MMECYGDWRTTGVMSALIAVITPALLRMNPPAPSSLPALQVLPRSASRCPAHELMDVYRTNCILFAQTAPWSSATTTSSPIEIVDRLNYAGYANAHRYALTHPSSLWQRNAQRNCSGRVIIASPGRAVFINNNASDICASRGH